MVIDSDIIKLIEYADIYRCPACGKGIEDDECDAEQFRRMGGEMTKANQYNVSNGIMGLQGEGDVLHARRMGKQSTANEVTALRESNLEKDKRIAELGAQLDMLHSAKFSERNYHALTSRITDLENRLEALQSSQSQVSDADMYIEIVEYEPGATKINYSAPGYGGNRTVGIYACYLQPSTPKEQAD
jgi:hypothetical protein